MTSQQMPEQTAQPAPQQTPQRAPGNIATPAVPARIAGLARVALRAPVFISDLHLSTQRPLSLACFHDFLERLAPPAAELCILGDLFEFWAGDDTLQGTEPDDALGGAVADALARVAGRGIAIYLMHGNRDVLLGSAFLARSGAQLLADPTVATIHTGGEPLSLLLTHGDAYCTLDLPYQAFRRQARDAAFQAGFLAQPLAQRRALIGQARARSEAGKQQMPADIMDVTPGAIDGALRAAGLHHVLHGHTHRPAHHAFTLDGAPAHRWVLPDWECEATPRRGGGLRWVPGSALPVAIEVGGR
jgi:UDP-2,3-diacylglucosamine hydrolase